MRRLFLKSLIVFGCGWINGLAIGGTPTGSVVGYTLEADSNSPQFKSVALPPPTTNQNPYEISIWNGSTFQFFRNLPGLQRLDFPDPGVTKFRILGIDPNENICADTGGFLIEVTFTKPGLFEGKKIPITSDVPNPKCAKQTSTNRLDQMREESISPTLTRYAVNDQLAVEIREGDICWLNHLDSHGRLSQTRIGHVVNGLLKPDRGRVYLADEKARINLAIQNGKNSKGEVLSDKVKNVLP